MIWRHAIFILAFCWLTIFVGCTPNGGSPSKGLPSPGKSGTPGTPPPAQGTVDSGGGNTYLGKPLESYIRKPIEDLSSYRSLIKPILDSLHENAPSIEPVFLSILTKKTWYFVPGELTTLPKEKIGSSVVTDQGALQDFKQVWVSQDIFDKMSEIDQAKLILHEVLMGFRLLRFDSAKNECLAFETKFNECMNSSEKTRGKPSDLTTKDYADIRTAVIDIQENYKNMSFSDWDDMLWRYGFSSFDRRFSGKKTKTKLSKEQLTEMLSGANLLGSWPKYGFEIDQVAKEHPELIEANFNPSTPFVWESKSSCEFDISIENDQFIFTLSTQSGKINRTAYFNESTLELQDIQGMGGVWVSRVALSPGRSDKNRYEKGQSRYDVSLDFVGKRLSSVYIYEATCLNADCSSYSGAENGTNYTCSSEKSITLGARK